MNRPTYAADLLRIPLLLVCLWWTGASVQAQAGLLAREDARFQAQISRDTASLHELLAQDLVYIHSNALAESKADFIQSVGSGRITYLSMQAESGRRIRSLGRRAAAVDGIVGVKGLFKGNAFEMRLRYTAVYSRQKGQWKLWSWQSTRMVD